MSGEDQQRGDEISLNLPRKSAHDTYLMGMQIRLQKFDQIIFTMPGPTDMRIVPYTRNCIAGILDDGIKEAMFKALRDALQYVKSIEGISVDEKGWLQIEVCQAAISQVHSYLDEYVGLSRTNALIPISSTPTQEEVAASLDILRSGGDIEVGGEEMSDPESLMMDPDTVYKPMTEEGKS